MLTEEQALAELRQLNVELGLPENDGIPMTQAQAEAELRALDEELASTPESFDEYVARRKEEDKADRSEKRHRPLPIHLLQEPAHWPKRVAEQSSNCLPVMSDLKKQREYSR